MAMDSTPWLVGGGAEHTAETARMLAYVATGGHEGVAEPGDLKVTPLAVPGGGVRVAPGGVLVRNSNPGGGQQTYVARNPQTDTVSVQAAGSSGGRADMIAVVVRDPQYPGTPVPSDPVSARYVDIEVIQGVPSNARTAADAGLTFPAYPLARINLPASTGTVQASHITDLRGLANSQNRRVKLSQDAATTIEIPRTDTYRTLTEFSVEVPEWATHAAIDAGITGAWMRGENGRGDISLSGLGIVGADVSSPWYEAAGSPTGFRRIPYLQVGHMARVPEGRRGSVQSLFIVARVRNSSDSGFVFGVDYGARTFLDIDWIQDIE